MKKPPGLVIPEGAKVLGISLPGPEAPTKAPRARRAKANPLGITEAEVQRDCLAALHARGVLAWRSNSRVFMVPGKGGRERPMRAGLGNGSADIVGILPGGRFLAIECKRPGERPTPGQVAWLRAVNRQGGLAFCVDSSAMLGSVLDALNGTASGYALSVEILDNGDFHTTRTSPR